MGPGVILGALKTTVIVCAAEKHEPVTFIISNLPFSITAQKA
jgi:hypothetical protein